MYHELFIVGNLGRDPEMQYTPSGTAVTNFSVASNRQYTNSKGEPVKETIWFRVSVFDKQAETVNQYLHKGSKVLVVGRLSPDLDTGGPKLWQTKEGKVSAAYDVVAHTVRFLSTKAEDEAAAKAGSAKDDWEGWENL